MDLLKARTYCRALEWKPSRSNVETCVLEEIVVFVSADLAILGIIVREQDSVA